MRGQGIEVQENIDSWTDRHTPTVTLLSESYNPHARHPTHAKYFFSLLKKAHALTHTTYKQEHTYTSKQQHPR
jgi:hypothetical protein